VVCVVEGSLSLFILECGGALQVLGSLNPAAHPRSVLLAINAVGGAKLGRGGAGGGAPAPQAWPRLG
jgi:hypothetical protein